MSGGMDDLEDGPTKKMLEGNLTIDELVPMQGWSDNTMMEFAEQFISDQGLWEKYTRWLNEKAKEENAG